MTRAVPSAAIDSEWSFVTSMKPCPICGGDAGCSVHAADDFACCEREPSDWKLTNGAWLHRVKPALQHLASTALIANSTDGPHSETQIRI